MKRYGGELAVAMLFVTIFSIGMMTGGSLVLAQDQGGSLAKQIQGSWILVAAINEQDRKNSDTFGPNPKGFLVLTPDGRFSMIMMRASLPKFTANNRLEGTAKENQAVVQGSQAMFRTYKVTDEIEHTVMLHFEGCTFPNWDGQDLPRIMAVSGDAMTHINPAAAIGGTNYLVWKRAK